MNVCYLNSRVSKTQPQCKTFLEHAGRVWINRERPFKFIDLPSFVSGPVSPACFVVAKVCSKMKRCNYKQSAHDFRSAVTYDNSTVGSGLRYDLEEGV